MIIKRIIKHIGNFIKNIARINIHKTLYVNYKEFPFFQAIRLPILVFGKLKIHRIKGKISINGPVKFGMIKIGYKWIDLWNTGYLPSQLWLDGKLEFSGQCVIGGGVGLFIQKKNAVLKIGNKVVIGSGTILKAIDNISIGDNTRITFNCIIMDSNMHYVKNIDTGKINKTWSSIIIGKNCWINSGTSITKGTVLTDYSIVARNSYLNQDFSSYGNHLFLTGSPAKIKSTNVQRIFSTKKENELNKYFIDNNEENITEETGVFDDENDYFK